MNMCKKIQKDLKAKVPGFARKVKPIYDYLQWHWRCGDNAEMIVPTLMHIEQHLYRDIEDMKNWSKNDENMINGSISGGGLTVFVEDDGATAGLSFTLDEYIFY